MSAVHKHVNKTYTCPPIQSLQFLTTFRTAALLYRRNYKRPPTQQQHYGRELTVLFTQPFFLSVSNDVIRRHIPHTHTSSPHTPTQLQIQFVPQLTQ